jgi:hypothetical protein
VPGRKSFIEGGYEVVNSWLVPGGGELLIDAALELLKELKSPKSNVLPESHVILTVEDNGTPNLVAYRRAIIEIQP